MRILPLSLLAVALLAGCDALDTASGDAVAVRYAVEGDAAVSYLDGADLRTAQARGSWETRIEAEPGDVISIEAVSDDGEAVEVIIEINGVTVRIERGARVRIDLRDDDRDDGEVEVEGAIEAVDGDAVTVRGLVFVVDDGTRLLGRDNEALPLSAFAVGTYVEAEGHARADGTYRAKKLKLEDRDGDDDEGTEVEIEGTIDALDATSVTVAGTRFTTDAATRWLDDDGDPLDRSAFAVGDRVEAEGHASGGVLYAEKVKMDDD